MKPQEQKIEENMGFCGAFVCLFFSAEKASPDVTVI